MPGRALTTLNKYAIRSRTFQSKELGLNAPVTHLRNTVRWSGSISGKDPGRNVGVHVVCVQRLAEGEPILEEEDGVEKAEVVEDDRSLRLLDIKRGSAVFRLSAPSGQEAVSRIRAVGRFLTKPDDVGENDYILNPMERLSATARSLKCNIVLREPGRAWRDPGEH